MGLTGRDPPPPSPPPVITQQPLNQHVHRLLEWSQNWTERLMLKWDSFPVRTAQLDKGWTQTEMSPADVGGGGCRTLGLCLLRGSVGALFGQWTPRFLFSRSTSPLSNTTQHSKTVQSRQLPPWVSISAACFCKPQFWRWATPSASVPVF